MEIIMALGETIRNRRKAKGLTLQDLGSRLGLSYQAVQKWEKDKTEPSTTQLVSLSKILEIPLDELVTNEDTLGEIRGIIALNSNLMFNIPFITVINRTYLASNFTDYSSVTELNETFPVFSSNPKFNENQVVIEIEGDTMGPRLLAGTKVLAEAIPTENFPDETGGIYAVLYNKRFAVRRIINNDIKEHNRLLLHADNNKYDPLPVEGTAIRAMWKVIRIVDAPID